MNKITHQLTQVEHLERIAKVEVITRRRRTMKRKTHNFVNQSLATIALYSIVITGFLGVAALGCWGFEIIEVVGLVETHVAISDKGAVLSVFGDFHCLGKTRKCICHTVCRFSS